MTNSAIIYARASAGCLASIDEQVDCLRGVADSKGWEVVRIFTDRPMPVRRGREQRPAEVALLGGIRAGAVSRVLVFSADRLARTLTELVLFLETCRTAGVGVYVHDRRIDSIGHDLSLFDISAMLADHLRQSRRDSILRGQAAAREANIKFGRPPIPASKIEKAKLALAGGQGIRATAKLVGVSPASVSRIKAAMEAPSPTS